jgi:hypothetical protein
VISNVSINDTKDELGIFRLIIAKQEYELLIHIHHLRKQQFSFNREIKELENEMEQLHKHLNS